MVQPDEAMDPPDDSESGGGNCGEFIKLIENLKQIPREEAYQLAREFNPNFPENEIGHWMQSMIELSGDFLTSFSQGTLINTVEAFEVIKNVRIPALLIIGEKERMSIVSKITAMEVRTLPHL